jgi:hypothetical protein
MPLLAIQDTGGGALKVLGSNVDISTLSSKEAFRAVNLDTGFAFTTSAGVLEEYVQGFIDYPQRPWDCNRPDRSKRANPDPGRIALD